MDDEFDNFMTKLNAIESVMRDLRCSNPEVVKRGMKQADVMLNGKDAGDLNLPGSSVCRKDRTVINQKAFDDFYKSKDSSEMSKEAFMAEVEKDAQKRTAERKERKERAEELKAKANKAFREEYFEKALELYSKAINEVRDSCVLYENRALTYLHLQLYRRVLEDCDWALKLNDSSIKALLYKARALLMLSEKTKSEELFKLAEEKHPQHKNFINEYKQKSEEVACNN